MKAKRRKGQPGRRIPEAIHSMTRRRASPGPSGRLQVAMAFSQISSRGCRQEVRQERRRGEARHQSNDSYHPEPEAHPAEHLPILWEAATGGVCCTCLWKSSGRPRRTSGLSLWPVRQEATKRGKKMRWVSSIVKGNVLTFTVPLFHEGKDAEGGK